MPAPSWKESLEYDILFFMYEIGKLHNAEIFSNMVKLLFMQIMSHHENDIYFIHGSHWLNIQGKTES